MLVIVLVIKLIVKPFKLDSFKEPAPLINLTQLIILRRLTCPSKEP